MMIAFTKLLRRTVVTLSAIAALTVPGLATAQTGTVVLNGTTTNTCTYTSITPSGATLTFNCNNIATATFAITAPAQLPQLSLSTTDVKVTRSGTISGAIDVGLTVGGNCTTTLPNTITFSANGSQNIPVTTLAAGTACTVLISPTTGNVTGNNPASINVVDPDADVVFAFASPTTNASVGNGAVGITVTRNGGTNGTFTVPVTVVPAASGGGNLTPGTAGGTLGGAALVAGSLTFNNANPVSFTYTAPTANPTATAPWTMVLALGTPVKVTGSTNQGSSSDPGTNTITLQPKDTSCNATVNQFIGPADAKVIPLPSGQVYTYQLPRTTGRKISAKFSLSNTPQSNPVAPPPWNYEVQISKCAGQVDPAVGGSCYKTSSQLAYMEILWFESIPLAGSAGATAGYGSAAGIAAKGACYAPATEGPWYVNFRYNYADCNSGISGHPLCAWSAAWSNYSY
jgi:hypothetical protein